jgi:hypothetical protein
MQTDRDLFSVFRFKQKKRMGATWSDLINYAQNIFSFLSFCVFFFIVNFVFLFFRHIHLYKFKDKASKDELDSLQL